MGSGWRLWGVVGGAHTAHLWSNLASVHILSRPLSLTVVALKRTMVILSLCLYTPLICTFARLVYKIELMNELNVPCEKMYVCMYGNVWELNSFCLMMIAAEFGRFVFKLVKVITEWNN